MLISAWNVPQGHSLAGKPATELTRTRPVQVVARQPSEEHCHFWKELDPPCHCGPANGVMSMLCDPGSAVPSVERRFAEPHVAGTMLIRKLLPLIVPPLLLALSVLLWWRHPFPDRAQKPRPQAPAQERPALGLARQHPQRVEPPGRAHESTQACSGPMTR